MNSNGCFIPFISVILVLIMTLFLFGCNTGSNISYVPLETTESEASKTEETEETSTDPDDKILAPSELFVEENVKNIVDDITLKYKDYGMNFSESLSKSNSDTFIFQTSKYDDRNMSVNEFTKLVSSFFYDELLFVLDDANESETEEVLIDPETGEIIEVDEEADKEVEFHHYEFNCYYEKSDDNTFTIYFCYA